jgi:hypothetical protein
MSRKSRIVLKIAGVALTALLLSGCKKPPPLGTCCMGNGTCTNVTQVACAGGNWTLAGSCTPNPCRQPPPPPPPQISLNDIAQNEKADARVQFAPDVKVSEDKTDLGKAVVHLADAFARGDDKALKPLLTQRARILLSQLVTDGGWSDATKPIEAVRIVFMQDGVDVNSVGSATQLGSEGNLKLMAKMNEALRGVPPEQLSKMQIAATQAIAGMDPASLADPAKLAEVQSKLADAAKQAGLSDEVMGKLNDLAKDVGGDAPAPGSSGGSALGILMAIQDTKGAYLLGWTAEKIGDNWLFSNAPATGDIRARAAMWDNTGPEGFQVVRVASAPTAMPDEIAPAGNKPGSSDSSGGGGPDSAPPAAPEPGNPSPIAPPPRAPGSPGRPPGSNPPGGSLH